MKVKIGVTCSFHYASQRFILPGAYFRALASAGGIPLILPGLYKPSLAPVLLEGLDALVLSGGGDLDPSFFQEEPHPQQGEADPPRDALEIALVRTAIGRDLPLLCICRGLQVLNVACGGTLYQDLLAQGAAKIQHFQRTPRFYPSHRINIVGGTILGTIIGDGTIRVNSIHHQGVKDPASVLKVNARAPDGVIEGLEHTGRSFILGVQWHPEALEGRAASFSLFRALVSAAQAYRNLKG